MSCEKCEDKERMEEILNSFRNGTNHITPEKYDSIKKFAVQLKTCLEDMRKYYEKMVDDLNKCEGKDVYKDSNEILVHLKTIIDYATMEKANIDIIIRTIEIILGEMFWTTK